MFDKLETVEKRYEELTVKISDPEVISRTNEWREYMKEHAEIEPIVQKYREYKKAKKAYEDAKEMMEDPEMKDLAEEEMLENKELMPKIEEELKILLIPKDPDDDKNVICEIVEVLVEKKQPFLQEHYLECTICMQKRNTGN